MKKKALKAKKNQTNELSQMAKSKHKLSRIKSTKWQKSNEELKWNQIKKIKGKKIDEQIKNYLFLHFTVRSMILEAPEPT